MLYFSHLYERYSSDYLPHHTLCSLLTLEYGFSSECYFCKFIRLIIAKSWHRTISCGIECFISKLVIIKSIFAVAIANSSVFIQRIVLIDNFARIRPLLMMTSATLSVFPLFSFVGLPLYWYLKVSFWNKMFQHILAILMIFNLVLEIANKLKIHLWKWVAF